MSILASLMMPAMKSNPMAPDRSVAGQQVPFDPTAPAQGRLSSVQQAYQAFPESGSPEAAAAAYRQAFGAVPRPAVAPPADTGIMAGRSALLNALTPQGQ